jgi:putative spermidine/putrescine transport system permease protein
MPHQRARFSFGASALNAFALAVGVFLLAPSVVVIVMSLSSGYLMTFPPPGFGFRWYINFFQSQTWTDSAWKSVEVGLLSTLLAVTLGTLCAFGLNRERVRSVRAIVGLILSPLVAPLVITGIGMFIAYRQIGLGAFPGLVAAHTVLGLPYVLITVLTGLRAIDRDLELAALNLGASPAQSFLHVTLPLAFPSILIGAIFAFVTSWDEVVIAQFLATPTMRTMPVTMWEEARESVDPTLAAASSLLTLVMVALLLGVLALRRIGPKPTETAGKRQ